MYSERLGGYKKNLKNFGPVPPVQRGGPPGVIAHRGLLRIFRYADANPAPGSTPTGAGNEAARTCRQWQTDQDRNHPAATDRAGGCARSEERRVGQEGGSAR